MQYLISWWDVCRLYLLLSFVVRLPFVVLYLTDTETVFKSWKSARHEGKFQLYVVLSIVIMGFVEIMLAETDALTWAQIQPASDIAAFLGVTLGVVSLVSFVWIHLRLVEECAKASSSTEHDMRLDLPGPYSVVRHPLYSNFFLLPICVLLISHNWFYALLWAVWIAEAITNVYEEESLLSDLYGDPYLEYSHNIESFLPLKLHMLDEDEHQHGRDAEWLVKRREHHSILKENGSGSGGCGGDGKDFTVRGAGEEQEEEGYEQAEADTPDEIDTLPVPL